MMETPTLVIGFLHLVFIFLTYTLAKRKNRNVGGWTALAVALGFIPFLILLFIPVAEIDPAEVERRKNWQ